MQPRIIDPRSVARRVGQAVRGTGYNSENEKLNRNCKPHGGIFPRPAEYRQGTFNCNTYDSSTDTFEQTYSGDNNRHDCVVDDCDDEMMGDCKVRVWKIYPLVILIVNYFH